MCGRGTDCDLDRVLGADGCGDVTVMRIGKSEEGLKGSGQCVSDRWMMGWDVSCLMGCGMVDEMCDGDMEEGYVGWRGSWDVSDGGEEVFTGGSEDGMRFCTQIVWDWGLGMPGGVWLL